MFKKKAPLTGARINTRPGRREIRPEVGERGDTGTKGLVLL